MVPPTPAQKRLSLVLVFCCTLLGAAAQVLIKSGAPRLVFQASAPVASVLSFVTNVPLMSGLCLYGASTVLLVLALRHGELSILYPVIALTFVWVAILSTVIIGETMNPFKVSGIAVIVIGVSVLGMGGHK